MNPPGLLLEVPIRNQPVLVVGAGPVGQRRAARLLALGADVRWVAPDVPAPHVPRTFNAHDCDGMTLVFACAPARVNQQVEIAAKTRGIWVCRADAPHGVRLPGVIERGALRIAVSTGGTAPAAARAIGDVLTKRVPAAWGELVQIVAEQRLRWRAQPDRVARLKALIHGPLAPVLHFGRAPDSDAIDTWLQSLQASD